MLILFALLFALPLGTPEIIVNLFEWSHYDVAIECVDFLNKYGYDSVQVSPVQEAAILPGRSWEERYQPFSYRLVSRSGDEDAFKFMVKTCNNAGLKIYVDVVLNHMSGNLDKEVHGTWCSFPDTLKKNYPHVPYEQRHFHSTCSIDDPTVQSQVRHCEYKGRHDLNQSDVDVREKMLEFLNKMVDIGVAGFHIDSAKYMDPKDLKIIYAGLHDLNTTWFGKGERPYIYQEVYSNFDDAIPVDDYTSIGGVLDFRYSYEISRTFLKNGNPLKWFSDFGTKWRLQPWDQSVVFVDNQDTQRNGIFEIQSISYKQYKRYKMANGFMLAFYHERALVMSSYEFEDKDQGPPNYPILVHDDLTCSEGWRCEHRWRQIYNMVLFAKEVKGTEVTDWWSRSDFQVAFCRGNKGFVVFNAENSIDLKAKLPTCLPPGDYCDVVSGEKRGDYCTGEKITVDAEGKATFSIPENAYDGFIAIHLGSKLDASEKGEVKS